MQQAELFCPCVLHAVAARGVSIHFLLCRQAAQSANGLALARLQVRESNICSFQLQSWKRRWGQSCNHRWDHSLTNPALPLRLRPQVEVVLGSYDQHPASPC